MVEGEDGQDCKLQLNIWDAAGDNNVRNLAHLFVNNVQCGILVYAINSETSFEQLMDWHEHLRNNNENCLIALVGNKSDLADARTVSLEYGLTKQQELDCFMHIETSSYSDVESIQYLFKRVGQEIVKRR